MIFNLLVITLLPLAGLFILLKIPNNNLRTLKYREKYESILYPDIIIAPNLQFSKPTLFYPMFLLKRIGFVFAPLLLAPTLVGLQVILVIII